MGMSSDEIAEQIKEIRMQIKHGYVCYRNHYLLPENRRYLQNSIPTIISERFYDTRKENFPPRLMR